MIASVQISTPLSWPTREHWLLAWLEGDTLGKVLSTVRGDWGRRTPGYLSQLKMAIKLAKDHGDYAPSQGTISNIENDAKSIMDLHPEVRLDLLRLYPLSEIQIKELDERFKLKLPLVHKTEYLNNSGIDTPNSAMVWFTDVLNAAAETRLPVPKAYLESKGVDERDCEAILITDGVLMPESVRSVFPSGMFLVCTPKVEIKSTSTLVYRCGKEYVVLPSASKQARVPVMSADGKNGDFVSHDDERLEFLGVSIVRSYPDE
jgi:hypothetical protein